MGVSLVDFWVSRRERDVAGEQTSSSPACSTSRGRRRCIVPIKTASF